MRRLNYVFLGWTLATFLGVGMPAEASSLTPGDSVPMPLLPESCPTGCIGPFEANTTQLSWGAGEFSGIYQSVVYSAPSGLEFWYQVVSDAQNTNSVGITNVFMSSFAGYVTDVTYYDPGVGATSPTSAARTADGVTVRFYFDNPWLAAGSYSMILAIRTNAPSYQPGSFGLQGYDDDEGEPLTPIDLNAFAPSGAPIPEPASLTLVGLGLAGVARRLRRRDA